MTDLENIDVNVELDRNASRENIDTDPLAQIEVSVNEGDAERGYDLLTVFLADKVNRQGISTSARVSYEGAFKQWRTYMAECDRNPACGAEHHARAFIDRLLAGDEEFGWRPNKESTVRNKLQMIGAAYQWFGDQDRLSHPGEVNPVRQAIQNHDFGNGGRTRSKPNGNADRIPYLGVNELRRTIRDIPHIRDKAIIALQFKLGMRCSEVTNIQLQDLHVSDDDVLGHYDKMGSNPELMSHKDALVIPASRKGNKSQANRILPIDRELRNALVDWLLIRPDVGEPWLFLTKEGHAGIGKSKPDERNHGRAITDLWRDTFWPNAPVDRPEGLASHYGRHYFTNYLETQTPAQPAQIDYLRGDVPGDPDNPRSADIYTNPHYGDIEKVYRTHIYDLF